MKGRKAAAERTKNLRGNPGKRKTAKKPAPPSRAPAPPASLCPGAKKEWQRVAGILAREGNYHESYAALLTAYCACYARWLEAEKHLQGSAAVAGDERSPWLDVGHKSLDQVRRLAAELGLTPTARARMGITPEPAAADPMEAFLDGPKKAKAKK